MFCSNVCLTALVIFIAKLVMLFTMTFSYNNIHKEFNKSLSHTQTKIYKKIISERRRIYLYGYSLGLVLSFLAIYPSMKYLKNSTLSIICLALTISTIVTYFFYILHPKSKYMIEILKNNKQIKNWLKVYKSMQFKFHLSYLLGIIIVALVSFSICE